MRIIGLTGSIACGKTTVSNHLLSRGFPVVDGDRLARELTVPGSPVLSEIRQVFGDRFVNENGSLNRRALGQLVFRDDGARNRLDQLMAPYLWRLTQERIAFFRAQGADLCFLDMPLLFEKHYDRLCDSVWTVWLPQQEQLSRLMNRDGYSAEDAAARIRAVMSSEEKAARADAVIDNSGSVPDTLQIVDRLIQQELEQSASAPAAYSSAASERRSRASGPETESPRSAGREVMERPQAARRKLTEKKAACKMPLWIIIALCLLTVSIAVCFVQFRVKSEQLNTKKQETARFLEEQESSRDYLDRHYIRPLKNSYKQLIEKYAAEYNLNPAFVAAVIRNESLFDPKAVSSVGAQGLMQIMPDTAVWIGREKLHIQDYDMYDPETNIRFGCWYLNYLSNLFDGDPVCVVCAYHTGHNRVRNWLANSSFSDDGKTIVPDRIPEEDTKIYAGKVTRDYGIYQELLYSDSGPDRSADSSPAAME